MKKLKPREAQTIVEHPTVVSEELMGAQGCPRTELVTPGLSHTEAAWSHFPSSLCQYSFMYLTVLDGHRHYTYILSPHSILMVPRLLAQTSKGLVFRISGSLAQLCMLPSPAKETSTLGTSHRESYRRRAGWVKSDCRAEAWSPWFSPTGAQRECV